LVPAVAGGGLATIGIVLLFAFLFPALRRIDRFEDLQYASNETVLPPDRALPDPTAVVTLEIAERT